MFKQSDIEGKRVLLRADLDIPTKDGVVENTYRLECLLPTLHMCLKYAKKTCIVGHMGRPSSKTDKEFTLIPVLNELKRLINGEIQFISSGFTPGDWWKGESPLVLLDNLRFDNREEQQSSEFAAELASGADVYVYEAFATYRPCTSLSQIPKVLPTFTGFRFDKEVSILNSILKSPEHPTLLIGSGAKKDKLELLTKISPLFDSFFLGGVFAEPNHITQDGLDLNDVGIKRVLSLIASAKTIVLNGPLGKYEDDEIHAKATRAVFEALADPQKHTILGGGDTIAAIPRLGFEYTQYGFVSTGGGALLEYLLTGTHPLLAILN
jgi:phosphoglycerate kinase